METIYRAKDGMEFTDVNKAVEYEAKLGCQEEKRNEPLYFGGFGNVVDNYDFAEFALVRNEADWEKFYDTVLTNGADYIGDYYAFAGATLLYGLFGHDWVMLHDYSNASWVDVDFFKTAIKLIDKYSE